MAPIYSLAMPFSMTDTNLEISLKDYLLMPGMTQQKVAVMLGRTQGGIGFMLQGINRGERDVQLFFNSDGVLIECLSIRRIPLPPQNQAA